MRRDPRVQIRYPVHPLHGEIANGVRFGHDSEEKSGLAFLEHGSEFMIGPESAAARVVLPPLVILERSRCTWNLPPPCAWACSSAPPSGPAQNQLAGGGSFITLPALILTGMDARAANITSTVALFPGQLTGGWMARRLVSGAGRLSFRALVVISLIGGAVGSVLLLLTPSSFFEQLVPWLVLFATAAFAWGSFGRRPAAGSAQVAPWAAGLIQFGIAIYGGYFGGGIGFLMIAVLSLAGMAVHNAGATKNVLAGVMNASAVLVFLLSGEVRWLAAAVAGIGAVLGSVIGARMMLRVNARTLRVVVIVIGVILTLGMFARSRQQAAPRTHTPRRRSRYARIIVSNCRRCGWPDVYPEHKDFSRGRISDIIGV